MSVKFDPNKKPACLLDTNPFAKEKEGESTLASRWFRLIQEGQLAESLSSLKYCKRSWKQQTSLSPTQAPEEYKEFMDNCQASHDAFMLFVRASRVT